MEKIKVYVVLDKETGELMSYDDGKNISFSKRKKDVYRESGAEILEAHMTIEIKGIDY